MDFLSSVASLMVFLLSIARKCVLTIPASGYVDIVLIDTTRKRIGVVLFLMRIPIFGICKPSNTRFNTANKRLFWSVTYLMTDIIVNEFKAAPTTYRATDIRFVFCVRFLMYVPFVTFFKLLPTAFATGEVPLFGVPILRYYLSLAIMYLFIFNDLLLSYQLISQSWQLTNILSLPWFIAIKGC